MSSLSNVYAECMNVLPDWCVHGFNGMVGAECTVSLEYCVWNAQFHQNVVCGMHGFNGILCAECKVSPEWCVRNARFHRNFVCEMHGVNGTVCVCVCVRACVCLCVRVSVCVCCELSFRIRKS